MSKKKSVISQQMLNTREAPLSAFEIYSLAISQLEDDLKFECTRAEVYFKRYGAESSCCEKRISRIKDCIDFLRNDRSLLS